MAANLAKIAGRTAASRLVQPGSETDDRASGPPAGEKRQPPKVAAE
jgi:hypothetical protein